MSVSLDSEKSQGSMPRSDEISEAPHEVETNDRQFNLPVNKLLEGFAYCRIILDEHEQPVDFVCLEINEAFEKLTGLKREEVIGRPVSQLFPGVEGQSPELFTICGDVAKTGNSKKLEVFFKPLRKWLSISVYCPKKGFFVAMFDNITDRISAEENLKERLNFNSRLLECAPNPISLIDSNHVTEYVNPAFTDLTGFSSAEIVGSRPPFPWWPRELQEQYSLDFFNPEITTVERRFRKKNGELLWVALFANPIRENGNIKSHIVSWIDITAHKKAEAALQESEAHFRLLTKLSPSPLCVNNDRGGMEYVNDQFTAVFGYTLEDIPNGKTWFELAYPDEKYRGAVKSSFHKAMEDSKRENKPFVPQERRITCKDGSICIAEVSAAEIGNQHLVVFNDVTARRRLEDDLQKSNKFNQDLLRNAPNPIVVTNFDTSIRYVNPAFEKLTGFSKEELTGCKIPYPWWPQEDIQKLSDSSVEGRKSALNILERNYQKKNGDRFWISFNIKTVRNEEEVDYYLANWVDISERKKAEEQLKYRALLVDNVSDAIVSTRLGSHISSWNKAAERMYGWKQEEVLGKNIRDVLQMEFPNGSIQGLLKQLDDTGYWRGESVQKRRDGETLNIYGSVSRLNDSSGKIIGNVAIYRDITENKRKEAALTRSEAKYRSLIETSSAGVTTVDMEGSIIFANQTLAKMTGYLQSELIGKNFVGLVFKDDLPEITGGLSNARRGEIAEKDMEFRIICKDKHLIWVHSIPKAVEIEGQVTGFSVILQDVTQRVEADKALKESETKFHSLAEQSPNMIFINLRGRVVYANQKCEEVTGFTKEEFYSPDFNFMTLIDPKYKKLVAECFSQHQMGIEVAPCEYAIVTKDGKTIETMIATKLIEYAGDKAILGIVTNISVQKEAESKLRQAAQEWRTTFDSISDMVYIRNNKNQIVRMNRAFANAVNGKPQEIVGRSCCEVVHGTKGPHPDCPHQRMLETKKAAIVEYFEPSLGMYIQESISPIFDEKGGVAGTVNVVRNVSEHKKIEEQMMMADRLATIGELAAGVAHELNNPLTGIIGFSQLLLEGEASPEIKEDLGLISSEAQRAARIVKNLLTFARKHQPVKQLNQINDCINEVLNLRSYEQKNSNIKVITNLDAGLPKILVDYFQMQQVLINIIINAEYFMIESHKGGTLTITTEREGNVVRVSLADDGPGISQENLKHLFNPFFTTKEVGKGTGLGLAICHGIVSEHTGKIFVESQLGKGTIFKIELPL